MIQDRDASGAPVASSSAEPADDRPTKRALDVKSATAGLFACCAAGDAEALRSLFDECVLIDHTAHELDDCQPIPADLRREEDDATALLIACEGGHLECAQLLLKHGCPPGKGNRVGQTPVMAASFRGHPLILRALLEARASPTDGSMTDTKGAERTPLELALEWFSQTGNDACVRQLLAADERLRLPYQLDVVGYPRKDLGARPKASPVGESDVKAAAARRAEAAPYYASALVTSCGSGLVSCVERLLAARVDPNAAAHGRVSGGARARFTITPLQAAVSAGSVEVVVAMLRGGADARGSTSAPPAAGGKGGKDGKDGKGAGGQSDGGDGEAAAAATVATGRGAEQLSRDLGHVEIAELLRANAESRAPPATSPHNALHAPHALHALRPALSKDMQPAHCSLPLPCLTRASSSRPVCC